MNKIECSWGCINYATWNENSDKTPIIALHGWLDNCQSFEPLSNHITNPIIAVDLPGHGLSSHLPPGSWYHFVDYVIRIHEFLELLDIKKFHLIGHSLGGAIATLYASMFKEKIDKLILVDGFGPLLFDDDSARENLQQAISSRLKTEKKKPRIYKDIKTAIKATAESRQLSLENAELLVSHHTKQVDGGFEWTYDHKLKYTSPLRMTPAQLKSFVKEISIRTLLITVNNGYLVNSNQWPMTDLIDGLIINKVDGPHHFHMERPQETAGLINGFLLKSPRCKQRDICS